MPIAQTARNAFTNLQSAVVKWFTQLDLAQQLKSNKVLFLQHELNSSAKSGVGTPAYMVRHLKNSKLRYIGNTRICCHVSVFQNLLVSSQGKMRRLIYAGNDQMGPC